MNKKKLIQDQNFGFYRAIEMPDADDLLQSYKAEYYESFKDTDRRFEESEDQRTEREWQESTYHRDIIDILCSLKAGERVLDVGAGLGELVSSLSNAGYQALGIEPSQLAVEFAREKGLQVIEGDIASFALQEGQHGTWDAVLLLKVLEHIPNPGEVLEAIKKLLKPDGLIVVQVPNDFSDIQKAASEAINAEPWWIAVPHHLHYFNFESLSAFLEATGFKIEQHYSDFPMELFLLMGDDYVGNSLHGPHLHAKRRQFEMAIPNTLRQKLYSAFADVGIGRNATVFARVIK